MEGNDDEVRDHNSSLDNNGMVNENDCIEVEGLTTCLIVADVPTSVFQETESNSDRKIFEDIFKEYGNPHFIYLKSFKRVLVNFESSFSAAMAKIALHFTVFRENELKVYFKKVVLQAIYTAHI